MIMNIPFLTKPSVKFYSEEPIITDEYPIYPARDYKRRWVKNCASAFQKYRKVSDGRASTITAVKCPGIRNIMEEGWVAQTWHDFTIEIKDGEYEIFYPNAMKDFLTRIDYKHRPIEAFDTRKGPMKVPTSRNSHHIFKIHIPYCFDIPKGYELRILPIAYDDDPKFTACAGSCEGFQSEFNIHIFWHATEGRVTIPAGTPLCQIVPMKKEKIKIETGIADDKMLRRSRKNLLHRSNKFTL